jgi:hypothetical protein
MYISAVAGLMLTKKREPSVYYCEFVLYQILSKLDDRHEKFVY